MRSLTETAQDQAQPLNLQQRVIQSGLDSIKLPEAQQVVLLFQGLAVFREDQIVRYDVIHSCLTC